MAKTSGLIVRCYVNGYDISGDANSLDGVGYSQNLMETTAINSGATSRIIGLVDGTLSVNVFFEQTSEHAALLSSNALPTGDRIVMVPMGSAVGDPSAGLVAKQANYDISDGGVSSPITAKASFSANGVAPEFGLMTTTHDDTVTSSTSGTSIDNSASTSDGGSWIYEVMTLSAVGGNARWHLNLQHSADNSAWTDVSSATVNASDGTTGLAARTAFTGTLNRYVRQRVVMDASSGTLTYAIAFTRN